MPNFTYYSPAEKDHKPIKAWDHGVEFDQNTYQQLRNIARLPFVHGHVAAMPDAHVGIGATVGSVIATKGAIVPGAVGVDIGCFTGDTKIPLLNGSQKTLKQMHEQSGTYWVYSIGEDLDIVPGRAVCVKTREKAELVKVVVSGGDEIICTPDQRFMLLDGSYCQAQDLVFNQSVMPLYRKWASRDGYETCSNGSGRSKLTHTSIFKYVKGPVPKGHVIHHKDHFHFNNDPDNLISMTSGAHSAYHRAVGKKFPNSDPEFQKRRRTGLAAQMADPVKRAKKVETAKNNILSYMERNQEHFKEAIKDNGKRGAEYLIKYNTSPIECNVCGEESANPGLLSRHKKEAHGYNHKILSVEKVDYREDVYCLQVEEHHNFALAAGVFVHNCGVSSWKTTLAAKDLPDNLHPLRGAIERAIPIGRTNNGDANDRGTWSKEGAPIMRWEQLKERYDKIIAKHPKAASHKTAEFMGTLGTGNHFIEICLDEEDQVWVMLHSGSRGLGNKIGTYFIDKAKEEMRRYFVDKFLPDEDCAYLVEKTDLFDDYLEAVHWAQDFAMENRLEMMWSVIKVMKQYLPAFLITDTTINVHHNYVARENHGGQNLLVTRKGAVRAREGELLAIPGSMGTGSYIGRGLGSKDSFCSCSHGAGRRMSRGKARNAITLEDHAKATEGIECRKDAEVLDESPAAYKSLSAVMEAQSDLVEPMYKLRQVLNVKG